MRYLLLVTLLLFANILFGQVQGSITTMDFIKIKNENRKEALFYYENNWKVLRDIALEKGYIISYKLLTTTADTTVNFDIILLTEYADSIQFTLREERFQQIIKATQPNGPRMLNELKPNEFRQTVFSKEAQTIFTRGKKLKKMKTKSEL